MKNHTLKLPLDPTKRHFVVGDIHGRFDMFLRLLESADYDPNTDVVYTVGDMIDRGHFSHEVVEFFDMKNAFAVRGNHELMATNSQWTAVWMSNGGDAAMRSLQKHKVNKKWLDNKIKKLPFVIDVGDEEDDFCFRIVHADLPPSWSEEEFQYVLRNADSENDHTFGIIMWSRTTVRNAVHNIKHMKPSHFKTEFHPNRSNRNVFLGHTPTDNVIKINNMYFIDTWASRTLTMIEAVTLQEWSVPFVPYPSD